MILKLFLIFGQSEPNDSYKKDSYKKETVYWRGPAANFFPVTSITDPEST